MSDERFWTVTFVVVAALVFPLILRLVVDWDRRHEWYRGLKEMNLMKWWWKP